MAHGNGKADSVSPMLFETAKTQKDSIIATLDTLRATALNLMSQVDELRKTVLASEALEFTPEEKKGAPSRRLLSAFEAVYFDQFKDKYIADLPKDYVLLNQLMKAGYSEERLVSLMQEFVRITDPFQIKRGFTIGTFKAAIPGIVASLTPGRSVGITARTAPNRQNSTIAATMIRQQFNNQQR